MQTYLIHTSYLNEQIVVTWSGFIYFPAKLHTILQGISFNDA